VDGFRFDLATILGRETYGFDEGAASSTAAADPVLSRVKLIARALDCGRACYQGGLPAGLGRSGTTATATSSPPSEGDDGKAAELASRLIGSGDLFNRRGRKPWASVNFVTAHDGFTLEDLVSYNEKHNEANGEGGGDGHQHNLSWNHGVEGPTDDPEIRALRDRQKRNLLATLLLSHGTPMILAGDEFGRTQGGNNNAYCQDNEINWIDWAGIEEGGEALAAFTRKLIALRQNFPVLRRGRFLTGAVNEEIGSKDVTWITPSGTEMDPEHWDDPATRCFGMLLDGRAQATGIRRPASDATLLVVLNAHHDVVEFSLPEPPAGQHWMLLVDTHRPEIEEPEEFEFGHPFLVTGRSLLLFLLHPDRGGGLIRSAARAALLAGLAPPPFPRGE
jgi:glycogen operon protein